jgi:hypothetical protein
VVVWAITNEVAPADKMAARVRVLNVRVFILDILWSQPLNVRT